MKALVFICTLFVVIGSSAFANPPSLLQEEFDTRIQNNAVNQARRDCDAKQSAQAQLLLEGLLKKIEARLKVTEVSHEGLYFKFSNNVICFLPLQANAAAGKMTAYLDEDNRCVDPSGRETTIDANRYVVIQGTCNSYSSSQTILYK